MSRKRKNKTPTVEQSFKKAMDLLASKGLTEDELWEVNKAIGYAWRDGVGLGGEQMKEAIDSALTKAKPKPEYPGYSDWGTGGFGFGAGSGRW